MLIAQYGWAVGAGLAFLLLLAIATIGLLILLVQFVLRVLDKRPDPNTTRTTLLAFGFLQAWLVYVQAIRLVNSPRIIEWTWLVSFCIVIISIIFLVASILRRSTDVSQAPTSSTISHVWAVPPFVKLCLFLVGIGIFLSFFSSR
jgi:hypothetical protein